MAPRFPGPNCSLAIVVYDPAAAQEGAAKRARQEAEEEAASAPSSSSGAAKRARKEEVEEASASSSGVGDGAIVPHAATPPVVLDVQPINAVPAPQPPPAAARAELPPPPSARVEPPCLREHFLAALGLRRGLPVYFIDEKVVTSTDVDAHQNRFRIPSDGVERRLRALLTPAELEAANLLHFLPPRQRLPKPKNPADAEGREEQEGKETKKPKKKGKVHGGLRVKLVDLTAGAQELRMSRWDSSRGTVVKGEGYLDFIRRCSFREHDAVEIWAFVQRRFRVFGIDVYGDSVLHLLIVKKHQPPQRCRYCPIPLARLGG